VNNTSLREPVELGDLFRRGAQPLALASRQPLDRDRVRGRHAVFDIVELLRENQVEKYAARIDQCLQVVLAAGSALLQGRRDIRRTTSCSVMMPLGRPDPSTTTAEEVASSAMRFTAWPIVVPGGISTGGGRIRRGRRARICRSAESQRPAPLTRAPLTRMIERVVMLARPRCRAQPQASRAHRMPPRSRESR
jgi:hypothetical protein